MLDLEPDNIDVAIGLDTIYIYYFKQGELSLSTSDYERARYYFNKCLEVKPGETEITSKLTKVKREETAALKAEEKRKRLEEEKQRQEKNARALGLPIERFFDLGNGIKLELMWIPPGEFMMGSPESETGRNDDEGPQHIVRITKGFWIGKYEVTQAQWQAVMGGKSSRFNNGKNETHEDTSTHPVDKVAWNEAQEFLRNIYQNTGFQFRLPTEAEWEYACRAGMETAFYYGNSLSSSQANFDGNYPFGGASKGPYLRKTVSVYSYKPNAWGLYNMHGNVWEWCQDWYGENYYQNSPVNDPPGPSVSSTSRLAWSEGNKGRVQRGGSWFYRSARCRSASRSCFPPNGRRNGFGFRVILPFSQD